MPIKNIFPKFVSSLYLVLKNKLTALVCAGFVVGIILARQSTQNPNSGKIFQTRKGVYNQVFETSISVLSYAATEIEGSRLPAYHIKVKANISTLQNVDNSVMLAWNLPAESTVISGSYNQEMSAQDFQEAVISNNGVMEVELEAIVPEGTTIDFSASTTTANHYKMGNSSSLKITAESLQSAD